MPTPLRMKTYTQSRIDQKQPVAGAWSGLGMVLLWAPMILVIPLFPDLNDRTEVVVFWRDHGSMTLQIMALVVAGDPSSYCSWPT